MNQTKITEKRFNIEKILSIAISVIFFIGAFSFVMPNYLILVFSALILVAIVIYNQKHFKEFDGLYSLIYLIPILCLGLIYIFSSYSTAYYTLGERISIMLIFILSAYAGLLSRHLKNFKFKFIFAGFLFGILTISLMNFIVTIYNFGFFHALKYMDYRMYYDGIEGYFTVGNIAYTFYNFSFTTCGIQTYLIFPALLLLAIPYFIYSDHKCWFNRIFLILCVSVSFISLLTVISKDMIMSLIFYLVVLVVIILFMVLPHKYKKGMKIALIVIGGLLFIFMILFFINAQRNNGLYALTSSNSALNYLFNTNQYSFEIDVILHNFFSSDKLFGFPMYYDLVYEAVSYPSLNIFANQFMYGGLFGLIFFLFIIGITIYNFIKSSKKELNKERFDIYLPMVFIASILALLSFTDLSMIDGVFNVYPLTFTGFNVFFAMIIFFGGYYHSLNMKIGEVSHE